MKNKRLNSGYWKLALIQSLLILSALIVGSISLHAQKSTPFADKTSDASKISIKFDFPAEGRTSKNGGGYSANVDLLDPKPKKVALISYYLYDPGCGKSTGAAAVAVTGTSKAEVWRTSDQQAQSQVDGFYAQSIDSLKSGFKSFGMELLTPAEFLDTEEKESFFYGFDQESGKKEKTTATAMGMYVFASISNIKVCPTDKGYRPFFVVNEPVGESSAQNFVNTGIGGANRKMTSSLGYELANALGVDAVAVCIIVTRKLKSNKDEYAVDAASLYVFGPNPMGGGDEDKNRGQFYCGTRFFAKQLLFSSEKTGTSYNNIGNVMAALARKNANWVINREK